MNIFDNLQENKERNFFCSKIEYKIIILNSSYYVRNNLKLHVKRSLLDFFFEKSLFQNVIYYLLIFSNLYEKKDNINM